MAFVVNDRVWETTTTTGTGAISLAGAVSGYITFASGIGASNVTFYVIDNEAGEWEVGVGTLDGSGTTLARTTIINSSNAGSAVNFSAGTKQVFVDIPAHKRVYIDNQGRLANGGGFQSVQIFTTSGTWSRPDGVNYIKVSITGGGGGGGVGGGTDSTGHRAGAGGGSGDTEILYLDVTGISSVPVTVGAGGAGGNTADENGAAGGNTAFGTHATAGGGVGGEEGYFSGNSVFRLGGAGGQTIVAGDLSFPGTPGEMSGGDPGAPYTVSGNGAPSYWGGGGLRARSLNNSVAGGDGTAPGSGGAGGANNDSNSLSAGGDGADGIVVIEEFTR